MLDAPLYQPIEHPDYAGIEVVQPCEERWRMIKTALEGVKPGRVIDLGCHTGWFTRRFAVAGWRAFGIDRSEEWIKVAAEIVTPGTLAYILGDMLDAELPSADVALMLSSLMYLEDESKRWEFLDRLSQKAPILFLDAGGMYSAHLPPPRKLAEQIINRTAYCRATALGRSMLEGRQLWMFEREHTRLRAWWVMGGTGVGKRHWMQTMAERGLMDVGKPKLVWMNDVGLRFAFMDTGTLESEAGEGCALVRWQWGRENLLMEWARRPRRVEHRIALLTCDPYVQAERVRKRDGSRVSATDCAFEAGTVQALAERIREEVGVPIDRFDNTESA